MAMIPITERKYTLVEKIDETPEVLILKFMPEDNQPTPFDPGMFMMIVGVDSSGNRYTGRAFSIASDPSVPGMDFMVIKELTHGDHIGRSHFVDAKIGDVFFMRGPNGQFRFDPSVDKKAIFLAGGTGLAPFISMLRHIKSSGSQCDTVLLYSTKYSTEIILKEELKSYVADLHTKLVITVTRPQPGDGWTGQTGHITADTIKNYAPDYAERTAYICGPLAFVKAVKDALVSLGMQNEKIKADVWG